MVELESKPRVVAPENAEEVLKEHKARHPKDTKLAVSYSLFLTTYHKVVRSNISIF